MVILIVLLSVFIIMNMNKSEKKLSLNDDSIGHITKDAFLATKEDFEFDELNYQMYTFF